MIKVYAGTECVEIQGEIPLAFPTIERTLVCLISCTYDWPSEEESLMILPQNYL